MTETKTDSAFSAKLKRSWAKNNSFFCVGLDTDLEKIPAHIRKSQNPIFNFNKAIIDATADLVCAFKPQIAYYAAQGAEAELELTIKYIHEHFPDVLVILDSKRGDIGSTSEMYAKEAFDRYQADVVTVNPYMGMESMAPFLDRADRGVVILCRTSNASAGELQDQLVDGEKLYRLVARKAATTWNYNGNVLIVVGATYPEELKEVRDLVPELPFLVPGVGAQGGELQSVIRNGCDKSGLGLIINSSRGVIYASGGTDFDKAARKVVEQANAVINQVRAK